MKTLTVVLACTATLSGCGGGDGRVEQPPNDERPATVTPRERELIETYDRRIASHCVRVSRSLVDPTAGPTRREQRDAFTAARRLLALAGQKPTAPLGAGQDLRLFVSDLIENLEGLNCDPRLIALLEEGLARIPAV